MSTIKTRLVAIAATAAMGTGLLVAIAPTAKAATATINAVSRTHAPDIKSKGVIKTPTTKTSGVQVASRSYIIYKGKTVVARTSTQGKAYNLKPGTYTVKSALKYRVGTTNTEQVGTHNTWSSESNQWVTNYNEEEADGFNDYAESVDGSTIDFINCTITDDGRTHIPDALCTDNLARVWKGKFSTSDIFEPGQTHAPRYWSFEATHIEVEVPVYEKVTRWSAYKTATRAQTVTINKNSGVMTKYEYKKIKNKMKYSKVKSTVGGGGAVTDEWSWGKDDYVIRSWGGDYNHTVYFKNGKVYAKYW